MIDWDVVYIAAALVAAAFITYKEYKS